MKKYYIYQLGAQKEEQWQFLLSTALKIADSMTFNPIWPNWYLQDELNPFREQTFEKKDFNRILQQNKYINLKLDKKLKDFVASKPFDFWKNYYLEDPTFVKGKTEFIASKSRKEQVFMLLSEKERELLIKRGFDVWFDISGEML
jgi:hypothetical protein